MYSSFYTGTLGAKASMQKLDIVSNNLANINNDGFKPKTAVFQDLLQYNLNAPEDEVTDLQAQNGVRVQSTYTTFATSTPTVTESSLDFAILDDNAFFRVQDRISGDVSYTRDGNFHRGQVGDQFYLMTESGKYVLDRQGQPIILSSEDGTEENLLDNLGIYTFSHPSRLMSDGDNEYVPSDNNMQPMLVEEPNLMQGYLESSGTNMTREISRIIESQRAYSYALKMVQTSDEIMATINQLKG